MWTKSLLAISIATLASGCVEQNTAGEPGLATNIEDSTGVTDLDLRIQNLPDVKQGRLLKKIDEVLKTANPHLLQQVEITTSDPEAFSRDPDIDDEGSLQFYLNPNFTGNVDLTFTAPSVSESFAITKTLTVLPAADFGELAVASNLLMTEDSPERIAGFIGNPEANIYGPLEISYVPFEALSNKPILHEDGSLEIQPSPNWYGVVTLKTGFTNFNVEEVETRLNILPVNDMPSFTVGSNISVMKNSDTYTDSKFISTFDLGPLEGDQSIDIFEVDVDDPSLFLEPPTITKNGQLTFKPMQGASGSTNVSIVLRDTGGLENSGIDTSTSVVFSIEIKEPHIDDLIVAPVVSVLEDQGPIKVSNFVEFTQAIPRADFEFTSNSTATLDSPVEISTNGDLTFISAPHEYGQIEIEFYLQSDPATKRSRTIEIRPVNDKPVISSSGNIRVDSGTGAHNISGQITLDSIGPANESGQAFDSYLVSSTDASEFITQPNINPDGSLDFEFKPGKDITSTVTVRYKDNGGTTNGGEDLSDPISFTIEQFVVPTASNIVTNTPTSLVEDSGLVTIPNVMEFSPKIPIEDVNISIKNSTLSFTTSPEVLSDGSLRLEPAENEFGTFDIEFYVSGKPGDVVTMPIEVKAVNDAPSINLGGNKTVEVDSGPQVYPGYASILSNGPDNESFQSYSQFVITVDDPTKYANTPSISADGTLSFEFESNFVGESVIDIQYQDNGGTQNGGIDLSAIHTITLKSAYVFKNLTQAPSITPKVLDFGWDFGGPVDHFIIQIQSDGGSWSQVDLNEDGLVDELDSIDGSLRLAKVKLPFSDKQYLDGLNFRIEAIKNGEIIVESEVFDLTSLDYKQAFGYYKSNYASSDPIQLGRTVEISGNGQWLFASAPNYKALTNNPEDTGSDMNGGVFVYKKDNLEGYKYHQFIISDNFDMGINFGAGDITYHPTEDVVAIGHPYDASCEQNIDITRTNTNCTNSGAIHIFKLNGDTWERTHVLKSKFPGISHNFGAQKILFNPQGTTLVVAVPKDDTRGSGNVINNTGSAYVGSGAIEIFTYNVSTHAFSNSTLIKSTTPHMYQSFGADIAFDGSGKLYVTAKEGFDNTNIPVLEIYSGTTRIKQTQLTDFQSAQNGRWPYLAVTPDGKYMIFSFDRHAQAHSIRLSDMTSVDTLAFFSDIPNNLLNSELGKNMQISKDGTRIFSGIPYSAAGTGLDSPALNESIDNGGVVYFDIDELGNLSVVKLIGTRNTLADSQCGSDFAFTDKLDTMVVGCRGDSNLESGLNPEYSSGAQWSGAFWIY